MATNYIRNKRNQLCVSGSFSVINKLTGSIYYISKDFLEVWCYKHKSRLCRNAYRMYRSSGIEDAYDFLSTCIQKENILFHEQNFQAK